MTSIAISLSRYAIKTGLWLQRNPQPLALSQMAHKLYGFNNEPRTVIQKLEDLAWDTGRCICLPNVIGCSVLLTTFAGLIVYHKISGANIKDHADDSLSHASKVGKIFLCAALGFEFLRTAIHLTRP